MTSVNKALKHWKMETPDVWQHFKETKITLSPIPNSRLQSSYCNPSENIDPSWNYTKDAVSKDSRFFGIKEKLVFDSATYREHISENRYRRKIQVNFLHPLSPDDKFKNFLQEHDTLELPHLSPSTEYPDTFTDEIFESRLTEGREFTYIYAQLLIKQEKVGVVYKMSRVVKM